MIFVTVGHQTPFDRLVRSADEWASLNPDTDIFAQIGDGNYTPKNMPFTRWLTAEKFDQTLTKASSVVSHAGTGTILSVVLKQKALLVLPRRAEFNETRNDHQVGTAKYFAEAEYVLAIYNEQKLGEGIQALSNWTPKKSVSEFASSKLITELRSFIDQ